MIHSAVLLAAGRGARLRPYTDATPKPLLQVDGRPTLDYVLCALKPAGIHRVCLVTHHLEGQIMDFVGNGSKWGLEASFVHQNQLRGTGDALRCVPRNWIRDEPVMVLATDYILNPVTVLELVHAHRARRADITISLKECPIRELTARSSVAVAEDWRVSRIIEKPTPDEIMSPYTASFIFILPYAIWGYLDELSPSERGEIELQAAIDRMIGAGFNAYGVLQPAPLEWTPP